jgi:hypothetical protein
MLFWSRDKNIHNIKSIKKIWVKFIPIWSIVSTLACVYLVFQDIFWLVDLCIACFVFYFYVYVWDNWVCQREFGTERLALNLDLEKQSMPYYFKQIFYLYCVTLIVLVSISNGYMGYWSYHLYRQLFRPVYSLYLASYLENGETMQKTHIWLTPQYSKHNTCMYAFVWDQRHAFNFLRIPLPKQDTWTFEYQNSGKIFQGNGTIFIPIQTDNQKNIPIQICIDNSWIAHSKCYFLYLQTVP